VISDRNDASTAWNLSCCSTRHRAAQWGGNDSNGALSCLPFGNDSPEYKRRQSETNPTSATRRIGMLHPIGTHGRSRLVASPRSENHDDNHYDNQAIEALVHPGLLTHTNPRRILVVLDANNGAELMDLVCQHVLPCATVQLVHIATTTATPSEFHPSFLSPWSDDTSTTSRSDSNNRTEPSSACRDDPRVSLFPLSDIAASIEWGQNQSVADKNDEGLYDVMMMLDNGYLYARVCSVYMSTGAFIGKRTHQVSAA
jgi:hypothetical protein